MSTIHSFHPSTSYQTFPSIKLTWNRNEEVYRILECAQEHPEWFSNRIERAPSGTQLLFHRSNGNSDFKNDGYEWTRRKDGRLIREDHMKLKVKKVDVIAANYCHSAIVPSFHRRVYSLISNPDTVLVHYLNCDESEEMRVNLSSRIAESIRKNGLKMNHQLLCTQMMPILSRIMNENEIQFICNDVISLLRMEVESKLILDLQLPYDNDINNRDSMIDSSYSSYLSVPTKCALNRRNSCSSASRRGLSSIILARQPSAFSDSVDTQFISRVDSNCRKDWNDTSSCLYDKDHSRSHSGDTSHSCEDEWRSSHMDGNGIQSTNDWNSTPRSQWSNNINMTSTTTNICPNTVSTKGGEGIFIVNELFVRGHEYTIIFDDRRMKGSLIQGGVIHCITPPVSTRGIRILRVLSDETPIGNSVELMYRDRNDNSSLLQSLIDRLHLLSAAFNVPINMEGADDHSILSVIDSLRRQPLIFPSLLNSSIPSRTILHLAVALDFHQLVQTIVYWRTGLGQLREFDINAKDMDGETPLSIALSNRKGRCAMILANEAGWTMDDMERETERLRCESVVMRGGTLSIDDICHRQEDDDMGDEHAMSTQVWVMTQGETIMHNGDPSNIDGEYSHRNEPLEISMDTDVLVPDSPTMASLFHAVTSPGVVDGYKRDQMAQLARQLIEALPNRIKMNNTVVQPHHSMSNNQYHHMSHNQSISNGGMIDPCLNLHLVDDIPLDNIQSHMVHEDEFDMSTLYTMSNHIDNHSMNPSTSSQSNHNITILDVDFGERELVEFFSEVCITPIEVDTLQKKLERLKLNHDEQRDVYAAALVMEQSSFGGSLSPTENEKNAARTIQTCYRRYKQYCYLRRLHNAAVVVQKHFRLRRANQKEETHDEVQEHPSIQGESICIQVPNRSLSREHAAAATIQNAYRGHRKRQAAARLIQKFMRQTRLKLRKMHQVNGVDVCTDVTVNRPLME